MACQVNRYRGVCAACGRKVAPGKGAVEKILGAWACYCAACLDATVGPVWGPPVQDEADDVPPLSQPFTLPGARRVSYAVTTSGGTLYRNKAGRCEDAPCCGCCTI